MCVIILIRMSGKNYTQLTYARLLTHMYEVIPSYVWRELRM